MVTVDEASGEHDPDVINEITEYSDIPKKSGTPDAEKQFRPIT